MNSFKRSRLGAALLALLLSMVSALALASTAGAHPGSAVIAPGGFSYGGVVRATSTGTTYVWQTYNAITDMHGFKVQTTLRDASTDGYCALLRLQVRTNHATTLWEKSWKECNGVTRTFTFPDATKGEKPVWFRESGSFVGRYLGRTDGRYDYTWAYFTY